MLYTWNLHNIVYQLYLKKLKKNFFFKHWCLEGKDTRVKMWLVLLVQLLY